MSKKLDYIPVIRSYEEIRAEMKNDLDYRMKTRTIKTSLGRPLYYRINLQIVMTHECPYNCSFCIERKNPMEGNDDFEAQIESLLSVLAEHPDARLSITGGEPGLYPEHVERLVRVYKRNSNNVFCSINTTGICGELNGLAHINLSMNEFVRPDHTKFPGCTIQVVDERPTVRYIKNFMEMNAKSFSFKFISNLSKTDYPVDVWNDLQNDKDIQVNTFRVGDFFVYATFNYNGKHARVTLGDMWQQKQNDYQDGYSNIIIHPDGRIATNWR